MLDLTHLNLDKDIRTSYHLMLDEVNTYMFEGSLSSDTTLYTWAGLLIKRWNNFWSDKNRQLFRIDLG